MKKAILIICVLSVLALLVVPVVAGVLSLAFGPERLSANPPPMPGTVRQAGLVRPTQIARNVINPLYFPPGGTRQ